MRKFLVFLFIFGFALIASSMDVWLAPAEKGQKSRIVTEEEVRAAVDASGTKDLWIDYLMYYDMGADTSRHYSWVDNYEISADTYMVWFNPPSVCSLLSSRVIVRNAYDSLVDHSYVTFIAHLDQTIDYENDFNNGDWLDYMMNGIPQSPVTSSPITSIIAEKADTIYGWGDHIKTTQIDLTSHVDNGTDIFGVGWYRNNPNDTLGPNCTFMVNFSGAPLPTHSLIHGDPEGSPSWYIWYYKSYGCPIQTYALVRLYGNPPPEVESWDDRLPDTYSQDARTVQMHITDLGLPLDSTGVDEAFLKYSVDGGTANSVLATLVSGDSTDGYYTADITGQIPGSVIEYWIEAVDLQGDACTTAVSSYTIRAGNPGHFLYVRDDYGYYGSIGSVCGDINNLTLLYQDSVDVWDTHQYGDPDASVYAYYSSGPGLNTVVWRGWGSSPDSAGIVPLLENGGGFWLSDQDQGVGLLGPPHFPYSVPPAHWVRLYLGIRALFDDNPLLIQHCITAYDMGNPILSDLFSGNVGFQTTAGQIFIAPYVVFDTTLGCSWTGSFDSLQTGATINMIDPNNLIISYTYTGPSGTYKVYNDFFAWDYLANPLDSTQVDFVAADTLIMDVLDWFGVPRTGIGEHTLEPSDVVKLYPVNPVIGSATIRFSLPGRMGVMLNIYDNTGRLIRNLINGTRNAGLNTVRWNGKDSEGNSVANGVYFYRLSAGNKSLSDKMVVVR